MTRRGYFEQQGDEYRLRIVKPGFDADDPNVSPNNVIIDSHSLGTLSVVKSGMATIPNKEAYGAGLWVVSGWNLPYVPLCTFLFGAPRTAVHWSNYPRPGITVFQGIYSVLKVTNDGIYAQGTSVFDSHFPFEFYYTAYRLPAT